MTKSATNARKVYAIYWRLSSQRQEVDGVVKTRHRYSLSGPTGQQ